MSTVVMLGAGSDIAKELTSRFEADGWRVVGWKRSDGWPLTADHKVKWDLLVSAIGTLDPIGKFFDTDSDEWAQNVHSNAILPLELLRARWPYRNPGASVCFFSGAGVSRSAATYSAYSASKMMLFKMTELLDDENADAKFFILGPGMVRTKIQRQTVLAGPDKAANWDRVMQFMDKGDADHGEGTPHQRIYDCLRWCMAQPKEVIGGRNIYVPNDEWNDAYAEALRERKQLFKLRRWGDGT